MTIDSADDSKITIRKFRIGPSTRIESRIGRTIRNRIESRSFTVPYTGRSPSPHGWQISLQSYPYGLSLTEWRYFHILSTCYDLSDRHLDWKNLRVNKNIALALFILKITLLTAKFAIFLCSVISQGKVVALDRWGGKWNHISSWFDVTCYA